MIDLMFACNERRGVRIRRVVEVRPTLQIERYLQDNIPPGKSPLKNVGLIWDDNVRLFLVDNVGVMLKGPLEWQGLPDVHIAFWDKILCGRELMCRSVAQRLSQELGTAGVFTATPKTSRATIAFAKRVGFQQVSEGHEVVVLTMLFT